MATDNPQNTKNSNEKVEKKPPSQKWGTFFGAVGAIVEWYDIMLYGYLSVVFARVFFPDGAGPGVALAATLGGFAVGFLTRPLGGLFFGRLGDRKGRKFALMLAITMMTIPMLGTAILPGYDTIGWLAPILLILFRMVQGFSSGGEFSGTLVFLSEGAAKGRRGRLVSIATTFMGLGILLASLVATILTESLTEQQLDSWGWRIAYLVGGCIIVVGIFMRLKMPETPHFEELQETGGINLHPIRTALKKHLKPILVIALLAGYSGIVYFIVMTYLVSYLESEVPGVEHNEALWISTVAAAIYSFTAYLFGWFSDKVGRKPPMVWSVVAFIIISVPGFMMLSTGDLPLVWLAAMMLMVPLLFFTGGFYPVVNELVPTSERSAGVSIGYNFGIAILGSTAPFVAQVLINITDIKTIPAWYLVVASIIVLPFIIKLPETADKDLKEVGFYDK